MLRLGVVADAAVAQRLEGWLLELVHPAPPLERHERLDPAPAAVADGDRVPVRFAPLQETALLGPREDALARLLLREARQVAGLLAHQPIRADDARLGEPVRAADLEIGRIVRRRHLQRARA